MRNERYYIYHRDHKHTHVHVFPMLFLLVQGKKNMTDDTFSQKIEWKLHKFIIAFNFMICVAALVTKTLNSRPNGKFCSLAAVPAGCRQNPVSMANVIKLLQETLLFFPMQ